MKTNSAVRILLSAFGLLAVTGCGQPMGSKGAYKAMDASPLFADGSSARPLPPGTVVRGQARTNSELYAGTTDGGYLTVEIPVRVTPELLQRGQDRFNIYCAACHGRDGYGRGMIVQRGFTHPPSYHTDLLRNAPIGHFFDVITNGKGAMYSYASRVASEDRWAIAAYIRVLQLSQFAKTADVPADAKSELEGPAK